MEGTMFQQINRWVLPVWCAGALLMFEEPTQRSEKVLPVLASDITSGQQIVNGQFRFPLGKIFPVECRIEQIVEKNSKVAEVTRLYVSSRSLSNEETEVVFDLHRVRSTSADLSRLLRSESAVFRARAFEGVRTEGIPNGAFADGRSPIADPISFGTYSTIVLLDLE
jgi:hypothetical protein